MENIQNDQKSKFDEIFSKKNIVKVSDFETILEDVTSKCTKFSSNYYAKHGEVAIVDQSSKLICGYTGKNTLPYNKTSIIFGDHTELFKYIDFPFYLGADGVKVLNIKDIDFDINDIYLYYYLKFHYTPTGKYERHFKKLKEMKINIIKIEDQNEFVKHAENFNKLKFDAEKQIELLEVEKEKLIENEYK